MNSNLTPLLLPQTQYQCAFNTINRGGYISTRPCHGLTLNVPGTNPQGLCFFTPTGDTFPVMVATCGGVIYTSRWPYTTLLPLAGATLSPTAKQVFACAVTKSVKLQTSGAETLIPSQSILVLSDGVSRPVTWDGIYPPVTANPQPPVFGIPATMGPSVFSNGRLWVAVGNKVYASDLDDPDTFTETLVVAEGGFIPADDTVTCLIETPDRLGIIMFTARSAFFIKSSQRDRTQWQIDPTFFTTLLTGLGCAGAKAALNQFGQTWFFSPGGLLNLNTAQQTYQSSRVLYQDLPMKISKDNLSEDCSGVCLAAHQDYLLCSVPSGDTYNRHTWCYDQNAGNGAAWSGIWTGVRPVEYATQIIQGRERTFFLSLDYHQSAGTNCHIWEAFTDNATEPAGPVVATWQSPLFQVASLEPTMYRSAELFLDGVDGNVNVQAWIGRNSGGYLPILDQNIVAPHGPFTPDWTSNSNSDIVDDWRPQTRIIMSNEFNFANASQENIYSQNQEGGELQALGVGRTVSILVQMTGVVSLECVRLVQDVKPTYTDARCLPDETAIQPLLASDYRVEVPYYSL